MVCLGNICRSPLAEGVLKEKLKRLNKEAFVDSAAVIAYHEGQNPDPRSTAIALKYGIDISTQTGRQIKPIDFETFHEIYAMDKHVYDQILMLAKTETQKEKVILFMETKYPGSGREVPDPYYGGPEGFENVYRMIDEVCDIIAERVLVKQKP